MAEGCAGTEAEGWTGLGYSTLLYRLMNGGRLAVRLVLQKLGAGKIVEGVQAICLVPLLSQAACQ